MDIGADILVEEAEADKRALAMIPFEAGVERVGAERLEERVADGDREIARRGDRAARIEVAELWTRHHLCRCQTNDELVGDIGRKIEGRQPILIAIVDRDQRTAAGRLIALRRDVGFDIAHAKVSAHGNPENILFEIEH